MRNQENPINYPAHESIRYQYYLYLLLILLLVSCSSSTSTIARATVSPVAGSDSAACEMIPLHEVVSYQAERAGYANVEGVMESDNYEITLCHPSESELERAINLSDLPIKVSLASANGDWYKIEYSLSSDGSNIEIYLNQERVIKDLETDLFSTGIVEQTYLGSVLVQESAQKVVVDFSQSRLAASRYFQTSIILE